MRSPPQPSPKGASSTTGSNFSELIDEREFDSLPAVIPDSMEQFIPESQPDGRLNVLHEERNVGRFSAAKDEISESALGEGFSWQQKQPLRPGQFSERPQHKAVQSQGPLHSVARATSLPKPLSSSSALRQLTLQNHPRGEPFDLPELGLQANHSRTVIPSRQTSILQITPRREIQPAQVVQDIRSGSNSSRSPSRSPHFQSDEVKGPPRPKNPHSISLLPDSRETFTFEGLAVPLETASLALHNQETIGQTIAFSSPGRDIHSSPDDALVSRTESRDIGHHNGEHLITSRLKRASHIRRRQSPASTCGDLEEPAYQSPRALRVSSGRSSRPYTDRPMPSHRPHERDEDLGRRSQSRLSNISIKRTPIRKRRSPKPKPKKMAIRPIVRSGSEEPLEDIQIDPERKAMVMNQIAHCWNECVNMEYKREKAAMNDLAKFWNEYTQITEHQMRQDAFEIERLQSKLQEHGSKLSDSRRKLKAMTSQSLLSDGRCKELEEQDSRIQDDNKQLHDEVQALQSQLSESKNRVSTLKEKHQTYRSKLNEAISEQQQLYHRSLSYYQTAKKELEDEKSKSAAYSASIDVALENSRKKREEMKKGMEELCAEAEREHQRKDQAIADLKDKIKVHEASLAREKNSAHELRVQVEAQKSSNQSAQATESKIDSLTEQCAKKDEAIQRQAEVSDHLSSKLDLVLDHVKSSTDNAYHGDIKSLLNGVQDEVVGRVLPAVLALLNRQNKTEETISKLTSTFQHEAVSIGNRLDREIEKSARTRAGDDETLQRLLKVFKEFEENLKITQSTCQQMEQRLDTWAQTGIQVQQDASESCQAELARQLASRNETVNELQRQLQLTAEDYAGRVEEMRAKNLENSEVVKKSLDEATAQLHDKLDQALDQERENFELVLRESEAARNMMKNQRSVKPGVEALQRSLKEEQNEAVQLNERIQQLEQEARSTEELRERWRRDIKAMKRLLPEVTAMKESLPDMNELSAKLSTVCRSDGLMQTTSEYLTKEVSWVKQQLASRVQSQHGIEVVARVDATAFIKPSSVAELAISAKNDLANRRVIVNSPCLEDDTPLSRPTVEQEQRQRRGISMPRSILKPKSPRALPESIASETESQFFAKPLSHTQYNRPVVGGISSAPSEVNTEMIEQIRDGLVQKSRSEGAWRLPTVADFERSSQEEAVPLKRGLPSSDDTNNGDAKRLKAPENSQLQDQIVELINAPDHELPTRVKEDFVRKRPLAKTYSRKVIE